MVQGLVARQPIFDLQRNVFGYELLYRGPFEPDGTMDGDRASSSVLMELLSQGHGSALLGQASEKAFINLTRTLLGDLARVPLTKEAMVLEILEDIQVDESLLSVARQLKESGYQVALDDFVLDEDNRPLIEHADIIKVDIQLLSREALREHAQDLGRYPVRLLAEKVENHEERALCEDLGFDLFQGFFFARPETVRSGQLPPDRVRVLQLMERIHDPQVEVDELAEIISHDVTLIHSLLRLINSAYFPTRTHIDSVQRAVAYLGLDGTRTWLTWTAMAGLGDKPRELQVQSLLRARMASNLGEILGESANRAFLVGLLSALDALMDRPLRDLLDQLPLAEAVRTALLEHSGRLGNILDLVLDYERGRWEGLEGQGVTMDQAAQSYLEAVQWAEGVTQQME